MATVKLDTVFELGAEEVLTFVTDLTKRGITLKWDGKRVNGWPVVTYIGTKPALRKMIDDFWGGGDEDILKKAIR